MTTTMHQYPWTRSQVHIPEAIDNHKYIDDFIEFHTANPQVYDKIMMELWECHKTGRKTSMKAIINTLRFQRGSVHNPSGKYLINDAFTSLYGAVIWHNFPNLRSTFKIKLI
jgi:hypothetical protein